MKQQERADELARAIENLLQGRTPDNLIDEDIAELLRMAKIRWAAARSAAHVGAQHEGIVWQQVLARLQDKGASHPNGASDSPENAGAAVAADDPEALDIKELQGVISLRRQAAEHLASLAEAHSADTWKQVQARIQGGSDRRHRPFFAPRPQPEAQVLASAVDSLILGEPIWEADDSRLKELLHLARTRRAMGQVAAAAASQQFQGRLWARLRPRLLSRLLRCSPQPGFRMPQGVNFAWPKLAAAGAAVALLLAAIGPIPATGLAGHPLAPIVRLAADHVGVFETGSPGPVPPPTEIVQGTDVTASEAQSLLGLPVHQPTVLPAGFRQVSSKFFPQPLTAKEGGMFVLAYGADANGAASEWPAILIYQEHAGGDAIAVQQGSALNLTLSDGSPATYVDGSWRPSGGKIVWGEGGAQTMVFDRDGLRTVIFHTDGPRMDPSYLWAIAEGMVATP